MYIPFAASEPSSTRSGKTMERLYQLCIRFLLVLDAHDPAVCRRRSFEEDVQCSGARRRVTRSIDLMPRKNVHAWLKYLRPMTLTSRSRSPTRYQCTNCPWRWSAQERTCLAEVPPPHNPNVTLPDPTRPGTSARIALGAGPALHLLMVYRLMYPLSLFEPIPVNGGQVD
ncbi:hypothetical protein H4582DRAFT_2065397 [Lactarius indigo]|nr:hypothetical protein H4582DRAFT_2065397 [Lactarius indigo]